VWRFRAVLSRARCVIVGRLSCNTTTPLSNHASFLHALGNFRYLPNCASSLSFSPYPGELLRVQMFSSMKFLLRLVKKLGGIRISVACRNSAVLLGFLSFVGFAEAATAAAPTFTPAAGAYTNVQTVAIATTTAGASIRYTIDGSTPSATAGILYAGPVTIGATTTLKAIAYKTGSTTSAVTCASCLIMDIF